MRRGKVRSESPGRSQGSDARVQGGKTQERRQVEEEGDQSQAGDCYRPVSGTQEGGQGAEEKGLSRGASPQLLLKRVLHDSLEAGGQRPAEKSAEHRYITGCVDVLRIHDHLDPEPWAVDANLGPVGAPDHVLNQRSEQLPDLADRCLETVLGFVLRLSMLQGEGDQRHGDGSSDSAIVGGDLKRVA